MNTYSSDRNQSERKPKKKKHVPTNTFFHYSKITANPIQDKLILKVHRISHQSSNQRILD